ncbi:hypothetical protein M2282_006075 [Variovorax boronicumulans]|uniref:hypothetical protein n=1 Tax=Variovorax boronicumulans TaxID=436515 RepID=UPI002475AABE|nr:hypothetical protein [Variovorax boronicumulans]MDH6170895.1 hypothetical protein [Variovorax boronicumulans]
MSSKQEQLGSFINGVAVKRLLSPAKRRYDFTGTCVLPSNKGEGHARVHSLERLLDRCSNWQQELTAWHAHSGLERRRTQHGIRDEPKNQRDP